MRISRREALKGMVATIVLNALPLGVEAEETPFKYLSSEITPQILERQKTAAIDSLAHSLPPTHKVDYLRAYLPYLRQESQMYIPDGDELRDLIKQTEGNLDELSKSIPKLNTPQTILA